MTERKRRVRAAPARVGYRVLIKASRANTRTAERENVVYGYDVQVYDVRGQQSKAKHEATVQCAREHPSSRIEKVEINKLKGGKK